MVCLLAGLVSCHGPALPALPSKGGPAWFELQSEHFTLWSDASRPRAQQLIRELEHLRQVVLGVGFAHAPDVGRSLVIALRDREEVNVFVPAEFVAYSWTGGAIRQPILIMPADVSGEQVHLATHELTHVISYNVLPNQPKWFAEGLANFFASVNLDPRRATVDVGKPLDYIVSRLKGARPTPVATMVACTRHACMDDMFYATAWAMFAYLANNHPQQLVRYAERLRELPESAQAQAWTEVFPQLTPDAFDGELRKWLAYGRYTVRKYSVELKDWPATERVLGDAEVLAARAAMRQLFAAAGEPPPAELAEALAADPTNLIANLLRVAYAQPLSADEARRIADAHPYDWRAWWIFGRTLRAGPDARMAREKACALLVNDPAAWVRELCTPR